MKRLFALLGVTIFPQAAFAAILLSEGFDDISTLSGAGWVLTNNSVPLGTTDWFQGNDSLFPAQSGPANSYIAANFENADIGGNISNWLVTPLLNLVDGDSVSFYTRTESDLFPDRLEVRLNPLGTTDAGATDASVGDFTVSLGTINSTLSSGGYPLVWTQFTFVVTGLPVAANARIAFRYYVTNTNANGDYIGIDTLSVEGDPRGPGGPAVPEPSTWLTAGTAITALVLTRRRRSPR